MRKKISMFKTSLSGLKNLPFLIFIFCLACAEPKYLKASEDETDSPVQESKISCQIQFSTSGHCLSWYWEKAPIAKNPGILIFKVFRPNHFDQTPVEMDLPSLPLVVLWMPSMGHGSLPTQTEKLDVGTYRTSNVVFIMKGEWQMKFQIKDGNSVQDEAIANITH